MIVESAMIGSICADCGCAIDVDTNGVYIEGISSPTSRRFDFHLCGDCAVQLRDNIQYALDDGVQSDGDDD